MNEFWFCNREEVREEIFKKGQSKRIWGELYKVSFPSSSQCCAWCYYRVCMLKCHRVGTLKCFCFIVIGDWLIRRHHPSAGCPWSHGNALQEHRGVYEEGEILEASDLCSKQVWPHPHLGHGKKCRACSSLVLTGSDCVWLLIVCDCLFVSSHFEQKRWVAVLSQEYPTLAFHASLTNSFGKGSLIQLLRQFGKVSTCQ